MARILWCATSLKPDGASLDELLRSSLASHRYRIGIPARELARLGGTSALLALDGGAPSPASLDFDCAVIGKITAESPDTFAPVAYAVHAAVARFVAEGLPFIVDVCDFHPAGDPRGDVVHAIAPHAKLVTCNSTAMADMVGAALGVRTLVVPDPVEVARGAPRAPAGTPLELLWYGHVTNVPYLADFAPALAALSREVDLRLTICSSAHPKVLAAVDALQARFVEWRLDTFESVLAASDLVIIPADPNDPVKRGAGNNRLAQALWGGRCVVANALESYREFEDSAWVGDDLAAGIRWTVENPEAARSRIARSQQKIERELSPEAIARRWLKALTA